MVRTGIQSIPRRTHSGPCPLSFAQQRLWFLNQLEPDSPAYNQPKAIRLKGVLHVPALKRALDAIADRHEALRTTVLSRDGDPVQVVADNPSVELPVTDLSGVPADQQERELERVIAEITERPFDLSRDLMLRAALMRLLPAEHVLLLVTHHIASDGWSSAILIRELTTLYAAFSQNQTSPLADLPVQYADFALWQRQWLQGEVLDTQLSYWKKQLSGTPKLELPTDRPRLAVQTFRGARQSFLVPKTLSGEIKALSRRNRVTLFMTLVAAFQTLLSRYAGQEDIPIGIPIANRTRVEIEGLIGFFANTLVLRTDLSGNPTFQELLSRVREVALGAYGNQDLPFERLVEEINPDRDLSRNPLFQVTFNLQHPTNQEVHLPGLTLSSLPAGNTWAKFDLSVSLLDKEQELTGTIEYNCDLFDAATIRRMLGHFQTLLEGIVANPEQRLSGLPILTEAEKQQLLIEWNDTKTDYPNNRCISELFEAQVGRTPDDAAVICEDKQLTYRELNRRANQLAHHLQKLGVTPETLVGICMERSLEMVVGLLGILKAGGAYLPLDSAYPKERLAFMLEDARAKVLLTEHRLAKGFSSHAARVVYLDTHWQVIAREREETPVCGTTPENLAYVIYTSGSTGRPKGVAVEHRQLLNYVNGVIDRLELPAGAHCALISTFAADLGHTVIFPCLSSGGCLHVITQERAADAHQLADYFRRHPIDCLKIVPSHLAALQMAVRPEQVMPRRLLVLGGEASRSDWVETLQALAPSCTIFNHYGPTEATVGVLTHKVAKGQRTLGSSTLPLGRPIANAQVYLLDVHLNPVPVGVTGELYIGGAGVARGYLYRPELTAERFIPNPFRDESGARLYKTGDLARYLPDGSLEFLGRTDHQVKLRGHRIELGEIETVLKQHPDVSGVAAVAGDDAAGRRLIAYVVPREERAPAIGGRRRYKLPNNIAVAQLNKNETDYMYAEIFGRQAYLKHGITINDGDCIFDVGANIGLFTLFVNQICKSPKIYAFEPNPMVFEMLRSNAALYAPQARLFNCGLSNETKTAPFTFFKGFSLLSGFYANAQTEKELVKKYMTNQQRSGAIEMPELIEQADSILEDRFTAQTLSAQLGTLSSVMEEENIQCIDLLKINVEKSELDVLRGIQEREWNRIKQIVLEVDVKENLKDILSILERQGYEYVVEQDVLLKSTQLHYIYAIRPSKERALIREQAHGAHIRPLAAHSDPLLSIGELKDFVSQSLPDHMVPSAFVLLETLPLTPNGKVDRAALPAPDAGAYATRGYEAPVGEVEVKLAQIWAEVLKLERVGRHDHFFELGGQSLLATQVVSRASDRFDLHIPLKAMFEEPTLAGFADCIAMLDWSRKVREESGGAEKVERFRI